MPMNRSDQKAPLNETVGIWQLLDCIRIDKNAPRDYILQNSKRKEFADVDEVHAARFSVMGILLTKFVF